MISLSTRIKLEELKESINNITENNIYILQSYLLQLIEILEDDNE